MVRLNGRVGPQPYCLFSNLARRVLRSHCRSLPVSSMLHAGSGPRTHSTKQFRRLRPPIALTQQPIWKSLSAQPSKSHRNVSSMTFHCFQPKRFRGLLGSPKPIGSRCPYRSQLAFDLSQKANPGTTFFCSDVPSWAMLNWPARYTRGLTQATSSTYISCEMILRFCPIRYNEIKSAKKARTPQLPRPSVRPNLRFLCCNPV